MDVGIAMAPDSDHRIDHRQAEHSLHYPDRSVAIVDLPLEDRELRLNRRHIQWHISPPTFLSVDRLKIAKGTEKKNA